MSDLSEIKSWVAHAEDDFESAETLANRKPPLLFSACFHAQQCAEKYMKAMLVFKDKKFPTTHDLNVLNVICKSAEIDLGMESKWLGLLSAYAVAARYPGGEDLTIEDAKEAIGLTKKIRLFSRKFLGLK